MSDSTPAPLIDSNQFGNDLDRALAERQRLLAQRRQSSADMPLRFWNQQAHFTTPASGSPEKAIRGLAAAGKVLSRFGIAVPELAQFVGGEEKLFDDLLHGHLHSPLVMVDAEDAVALTQESMNAARSGAVRCFTQEVWGPTLAFFRPSGLMLETCVEDLYSVLAAVGKDRPAHAYPLDGVIWPKVEHPEEIAWVGEQLARIEQKLGLLENQIKLQFLVESGYALARLWEIAQACAPRLTGIIWGIADYSADTNLPEITNDHPVCDWARYEIVNVAGALNVPAIDCMTLNYPTPVHRASDLNASQQQENKEKILGALKEVYDDALHGVRLGMSGKWVGHPAQLLMVQAAYRSAVSRELVAQDLREIEAYTSSVASGAGATMIGTGKAAYMADRATDRHLRARLRRATAWGLLEPEKAVQLGIISPAEKKPLAGK